MTDSQQSHISGTAASCLRNAASCLAACARPALTIGANSTADELSAALTDVVSAAELFGCKPTLWRWAADAASLLGRGADAEIYRKRFTDQA